MDASEVIHESLRLLRERDMNECQSHLLRLQFEINKGFNDVQAGKVRAPEATYAHLRDQLAKHKATKL
jgi:Arc/MetJ-type ribon-helix-helix transcriptional regulator